MNCRRCAPLAALVCLAAASPVAQAQGGPAGLTPSPLGWLLLSAPLLIVLGALGLALLRHWAGLLALVGGTVLAVLLFFFTHNLHAARLALAIALAIGVFACGYVALSLVRRARERRAAG